MGTLDKGMTEQQAARRYSLELGAALVLYIGVLVLALRQGRAMSPGPAQLAVMLSPMLPFGLALWAVVRRIRASDEFIRKTSLEHIAIAAAVTAGWTFTYGFMEQAGFPRLSMFTVWPVMGAAWGLAALFTQLRLR